MRESRAIANRWSLTLPQFDVLAELARNTSPGGFTFAQLSRLLLVTSGNLTGIVDRLEEQELVRREPDKRDRRVVRVRLTEKGVDLTSRILPHHADEIRRALSFMPRERLAQLNDILGQLRDGLHEGAQRKRAAHKANPKVLHADSRAGDVD
jgi:DNA-binding MarR family transcriptional regulator